MKNIKNVCVYCGHHNGDELYEKAAHDLGVVLAKHSFNLVYGGGRLGLMGITADAVLKNGGHVIGVIPHYLESFEGAHLGIQELYRVDTMHERKLKMSERADAFVIMPGGFGTLDELFEIMTWKQLKLHDKPIIIANINNYWSKLTDMMYGVIDAGFTLPEHRYIFNVAANVHDIIPLLTAAQEPENPDILSHIV